MDNMAKLQNSGVPKQQKEIVRFRFHFQGTVQGVGFRPFIYRIADKYGLKGYVQNNTQGVAVEVEGRPQEISAFEGEIDGNLPPLAEVTVRQVQEVEPKNSDSFQIIDSRDQGEHSVHICPDVAICDQCLEEFFNPSDRRYLYPFINCTNCGPRLTIIRTIPYDRTNTSMAEFPLCPSCLEEYQDPLNRRFQAEPNACPDCGPQLSLIDSKESKLEVDNPITETLSLLSEGFIIAVKDLGGFHLCVDATSDPAVKRLRRLKNRPEKPLAIMVDSLETAKKIGQVGSLEEKLLKSPQRPIVLLPKREQKLLSKSIAPGLPNLGVMLPYSPLHHLLLSGSRKILVMTSANLSHEPICIQNQEACSRLAGIADYLLVHNREIVVRCDDSIIQTIGNQCQMIRRSRGFTPKPVRLRKSYEPVLALGGELKAAICLLKDSYAFLSPHVGDLASPQARDFLEESIELMTRITRTRPSVVAFDHHPAYFSSQLAERMSDCRKIPVQHHHAHVVSCMAENGLCGQVIGLAMDGTGYGLNGRVWGGEFLLADEADFERAGHFAYYSLPGGEKAILEPWRIAAALLRETLGQDWRRIAEVLRLVPQDMSFDLVEKMLDSKVNNPLTSSCGRLFDAVAALLGIRRQVSFEGQAAMELEALAKDHPVERIFPYQILEEQGFVFDWRPIIGCLVEERIHVPIEELTAIFHRTIGSALTEVACRIRERSDQNRVVLSGGCFQNRLLLKTTMSCLQKNGFEVYSHCQVPPNDGGIALGQAVCAGERIRRAIYRDTV